MQTQAGGRQKEDGLHGYTDHLNFNFDRTCPDLLWNNGDRAKFWTNSALSFSFFTEDRFSPATLTGSRPQLCLCPQPHFLSDSFSGWYLFGSHS